MRATGIAIHDLNLVDRSPIRDMIKVAPVCKATRSVVPHGICLPEGHVLMVAHADGENFRAH